VLTSGERAKNEYQVAFITATIFGCHGNAISIRMFSAETTGLIFTKILHDIVAFVALFNHAYTWRYPIPFQNDRAISAGA